MKHVILVVEDDIVMLESTIAMLTAFDTPRVRSSCLSAGVDAFFSKTSEIDELAAHLRSISSMGSRS